MFYSHFDVDIVIIDQFKKRLIIKSKQIIKMQSQLPNLSPKSRSILYHLTQKLKVHSLLLDTHICNIFKYRKQKLTNKQFHHLIRKYDKYLILSEIDALFQELDYQNKRYISVDLLSNVLESICENDNPYSQGIIRNSLRSSLETQRNSSIRGTSRGSETKELDIDNYGIIMELKDKLVQIDEYLETIQIFITQKDGFLNQANVSQLMDNLGIKDKAKVKSAIKMIFGQAERIQLNQFLKVLELDHDGTRIRLQDFKIDQSIILEIRKSRYIKDQQQQRQSRISRELQLEQSKILQGLNDIQGSRMSRSLIYSLQMVPKTLQRYLNNGSQLDQNFAELAQMYLQSKAIFIDSDGPTYEKAKKWIHIVQFNPEYLLFETAQSIVYREDRQGLGTLLEPKDITQGNFGNCYFLSAIAAIVQQYPQMIYRLFVLEKNPSHIYGVRLFVDGIWQTIVVDGCFPLNQKGKFCGAQPHHSKIWVMLLQKAWAKIFKTYQNIHSGYNQQGLVAITGAPTTIIMIKQKNFLQKVQMQFKKGSIITCTTAKHVAQLPQVMQQKLGVYAGHAYTILRIYSDVDDSGQKISLIKMKNPWGDKAWKGDWSFQSSKWTKQLRQALCYNYDSKDGTFFINMEDFVKYFDHINISKLVLGNCNSYVVNNADRSNFYSNKLTVTQEGTYFFTIYQENGRKYKNSPGVYQKSPSWIFLSKFQKNQKGQIAVLDALACNASSFQHSTIESFLTPGDYIIFSKVNWNYWDEHQYVITCYGPTTVSFYPSEVTPVIFLNSFIKSRALRLIHQKRVNCIAYKQGKMFKSFYFEHGEGIGFIAISNNCALFEDIHCGHPVQNQKAIQTIQSTFMLEKSKGIQILQPYSMPVVIAAKNGQITVACFLVDPQGYSYKLLEGYKLYIENNNL